MAALMSNNSCDNWGAFDASHLTAWLQALCAFKFARNSSCEKLPGISIPCLELQCPGKAVLSLLSLLGPALCGHIKSSVSHLA